MKCPDPEAHQPHIHRWYTYNEIAALNRVSTASVHIWIRKAKAIGRGPTKEQFRTDGRGMGHAHYLVREDYALWLTRPEVRELIKHISRSARPANIEAVPKDTRARPTPPIRNRHDSDPWDPLTLSLDP
jgi:hypothetical protein